MSKLGDGWQEVAVERGGKLFGRQLRGTSHSKRCCNNYANFNLLRLAGTRTCRSSIATFGRPRKQFADGVALWETCERTKSWLRTSTDPWLPRNCPKPTDSHRPHKRKRILMISFMLICNAWICSRTQTDETTRGVSGGCHRLVMLMKSNWISDTWHVPQSLISCWRAAKDICCIKHRV